MIGKLITMVTGNWQIAAAILAALIGTHSLTYCQGRTDGRAGLLAEQAEARDDVERIEDESEGEAAGERERDRAETTQAQKDRDDAITSNATPGERPSAARNSLNCQRLRAAGTDLSLVPACGGRAPGS